MNYKLAWLPLAFISLIACKSPMSTYSEKSESPIQNIEKDFVLGKTINLYSELLQEDRTLNIYLPEDYNSDKAYPVIYLLDGSADEDFIPVVGLVKYNTFSWINRIPESIVVGIANTQRKRDFTSLTTIASQKEMIPNNGGSEKFIAFLESELQPYIESRYNTSPSKMIIGQSLAGLLVTEMLLTKPQLFDKYIIISPSLWWNDGALLKMDSPILKADYKKPTAVYIGVGKEGSIDGSKNHIMEEDAEKLANKIKLGLSDEVKVIFDFLPEEDHATVTQPAIFNAFRALYPKK